MGGVLGAGVSIVLMGALGISLENLGGGAAAENVESALGLAFITIGALLGASFYMLIERRSDERRRQPLAEGAKVADTAEAAKAVATFAKRRIFISYRRENDAARAGRISDLLAYEPEFDIFMDVDAIRLGSDFVKVINEEVAKSDALIAVIGRDWLDVRDEAGDRRLDNPNDFVCLEIAAALQREILVIPILVDGAKMPKAAQLPEDLTRRNAPTCVMLPLGPTWVSWFTN